MADIAVVVRDSGSGLSLEIIDDGDFDAAVHIRYPMIARNRGGDSYVLIDELDFIVPGQYDLSGVYGSGNEAGACFERARARQAEQ